MRIATRRARSIQTHRHQSIASLVQRQPHGSLDNLHGKPEAYPVALTSGAVPFLHRRRNAGGIRLLDAYSTRRFPHQQQPQHIEYADHGNWRTWSRCPGSRTFRTCVSPGSATPRNTVPTGCPSCSLGPATPVVDKPTRTRLALGHRSGALCAYHRPFRTPNTSYWLSLA